MDRHVEIRGFDAKDLDACYAISLATGLAGGDGSHLYRDPRMMGHIYVAAYALLEPALTFVVEDRVGVAGFVALLLAFVYRYGPNRHDARWRWITWGSAFAAIVWLAASALFSWYSAHFGSFNKTYGSLGAVIGFMTWMWLSIIVVLVGAKLNARK